ncbi:hypothetical protein ZTR_08949 [Talaromyces verruculosus]|nr:hypothetical protein ZTR_08949 [Talaromyces verruculosus]
MVGIAGGVPHPSTTDIRLGDTVVGKPSGNHGGVIQYDYGKTVANGIFQRTGCLNKPPAELLSALATLKSNDFLAFASPGSQYDFLFDPLYPMLGSAQRNVVSNERVVISFPRLQRSFSTPLVHYGVIASGNQVMRDAVTRDNISCQLEDVLCFEMEDAGLMDQFPCLVAYAAATAAAYVKELLGVIPLQQTEQESAAAEERGRGRLKQSLMCSASVDVITYNWVEGKPKPVPDFNINHKYRDFKTLLKWQNNHKPQSPKARWDEIAMLAMFIPVPLDTTGLDEEE